MAIRLRTVDGVRVALCAVESDPMPDDIYLDDGDHHALSVKFARDFASMDFIKPEKLPLWTEQDAALADSQRVRGAEEEHRRWELLTQRRLRDDLLKVELQLAERLKLDPKGVRQTLMDLDRAGKLIEDGLVADWHELYAQNVKWGVPEQRWKDLEPLACRIHDAIVCSGSDDEQEMAHGWYQKQAVQDPCPACLAVFDILDEALPAGAKFSKPI